MGIRRRFSLVRMAGCVLPPCISLRLHDDAGREPCPGVFPPAQPHLRDKRSAAGSIYRCYAREYSFPYCYYIGAKINKARPPYRSNTNKGFFIPFAQVFFRQEKYHISGIIMLCSKKWILPNVRKTHEPKIPDSDFAPALRIFAKASPYFPNIIL